MIMSKQEFLATSGVDGQALEVWIEQHWVIPHDSPEGPAFSLRDVARARLIQDLKRDFGVNDEGVDLVLHLLDQLHGMRHTLAQLKSEFERRSG